jgi:hypothetical protein
MWEANQVIMAVELQVLVHTQACMVVEQLMLELVDLP